MTQQDKHRAIIRAYRYKLGLYQEPVKLVTPHAEAAVIRETCKLPGNWSDSDYNRFAQVAEKMIWGGGI